ncbi:MAG: efflux RND transporter periplasmic adaptor subunit [Verrucomicrobia bacterium]|nr:efflux RND transporter periplasmic adaptor subunit [Verrucomicrobiota bacterium]
MYHSFLLLIASMLLCACQKATPSSSRGEPAAEKGEGDTVQLKKGHGLALHPKLRQSIALQVGEVSQEPLAAVVHVWLHVIRGADGLRPVAQTAAGGLQTEARGWVTAEKAALLKAGQTVELRVAERDAKTQSGIVQSVEPSSFAALGEYEVVVETEAPFDVGSRLAATFHAPLGAAVTVVPRSALLQTAEGWFVYAVNESFFLRTAVKLGAMNEQFAEVTEGLYVGDQIVIAPVDALWMAELQLLRGGKACTCGH